VRFRSGVSRRGHRANVLAGTRLCTQAHQSHGIGLPFAGAWSILPPGCAPSAECSTDRKQYALHPRLATAARRCRAAVDAAGRSAGRRTRSSASGAPRTSSFLPTRDSNTSGSLHADREGRTRSTQNPSFVVPQVPGSFSARLASLRISSLQYTDPTTANAFPSHDSLPAPQERWPSHLHGVRLGAATRFIGIHFIGAGVPSSHHFRRLAARLFSGS
jgi:hypothetical protein